MGYKRTSYSIPALNVAQATYVSFTTTIFSGWSAIAIPAHTGTYTVVPEIATDHITMIKESGDDRWGVDVALQLADAGGTVRVTYALGYAMYASYTGSSDGQQFYIGRTIAFALASCRLALTITKTSAIRGCKGSCAFSGGNIHIFTESTEPIVVDANAYADQDTDLPLHRVVTAGATGREIRKIRYRLDQSAAGAGDWDGTAEGEAILRMYQ